MLTGELRAPNPTPLGGNWAIRHSTTRFPGATHGPHKTFPEQELLPRGLLHVSGPAW